MSLPRSSLAPALLLFLSFFQTTQAQLSKGYLILISRGLQLQGMVTSGDVFHLDTYSNADFTSINWIWDSNPPLMGPAPGFPWSRWVQDETNMPGMPPRENELPYLDQLVSIQLADEWNLNDDSVRARAVNWFNSLSNSYPNTILYANNFGGQVSDAQLGDFIVRARPDMISFDSYPWKSDYVTTTPIPGPPTSWYGDLRRYRQWAFDSKIPFASYRQTFHAVQDYDQTRYRDPSPSELCLNTFAALAFNAKTLINFTYNTGASSIFSSPGGDTYTNALYAEMADINLRAKNLGKALVRLQPVYDLHNTNTTTPPPGPGSDNPNFPNGYTTSIMFIRGKTYDSGATNFTPVPNSLIADPDITPNVNNPNSLAYTWWEFNKNDPYLSGFGLTNKAAVKNNGLPGDALIAWFRPLDETFDGTTFSNQVYFMVVNGLTDPTGTAADCMQEIHLDFTVGTSGITSAVILDPLTGQLQTNVMTVPTSGKRRITLDLNGGDAALFKLANNAPFVGFYPTQPAKLSAALQSSTPTITMQGTVAARYQLEVATSLPATNWTALTNLLLPSSPFVFQETTSSSASQRFYRAVGIQ